MQQVEIAEVRGSVLILVILTCFFQQLFNSLPTVIFTSISPVALNFFQKSIKKP